MALIEVETVKGYIQRILPIGREYYIDEGLEQSNRERAEKIASEVRERGHYPYGPMWAEYNGMSPNGTGVFLQASQEAFIVHISRMDGAGCREHARWDRKQKIVKTFGTSDPSDNNRAIMDYQVARQGERVRDVLLPYTVSCKFASLLGVIEETMRYPNLWALRYSSPVQQDAGF
jgi:hypothetical protein